MNITLGNKLVTGLCLIITIILIPILVLNCVIIIKSYSDKNNIPRVAGIFPLVVLSDSMLGEFETGDLIVCKAVDPASVKVGDVISFYDPDSEGRKIVSHRVVEIASNTSLDKAFITKGDGNNASDLSPVPFENLAGQYWFKIAGLGYVVMFLQTTKGLLLCVFLPTLLLLAISYFKERKRAN